MNSFTKESSYDHIIRGRPSQRFCKISVLKNFAKFTGKHLCRIHFLKKVAGRKISQNS